MLKNQQLFRQLSRYQMSEIYLDFETKVILPVIQKDFSLGWFYGTPTIVGHLMPNLFLYI